MRLFSSILFALMAFVLPMAGMPHHFCTVITAFVEDPNGCQLDEDEECCKRDAETPSNPPECVVPAKMIPDAEPTIPFQTPDLETDGIFQEVRFSPAATPSFFEVIAPHCLRGPPDLSRTYAVHCRVLI